MVLYIATTHAQLQNDILTIKEQIMGNFLTYRGADIWNSLPENLKKKGSYRLF